MGLFTSVIHPTVGEVQFKHGDDFQSVAELGKPFVSVGGDGSCFKDGIGLPPDGIHWGYSGRWDSNPRNWLVVVKDNVAVALVPSVVPGKLAIEYDVLPPDVRTLHDEQVAEIEAQYGVASDMQVVM